LTLAFLLVSNHCKARKIRADLPTEVVDCFVDKWRTTLSNRAGSGFAVSAQILRSNDGNAAYEPEVSSKKPAINFSKGVLTWTTFVRFWLKQLHPSPLLHTDHHHD
jgi:hypothetical protein